MAVSADVVKELRDKTGISVMECKKALEEAGGDMDKAIVVLSRRSAEIARKKGDRSFGAGTVASYIHNTGQVGAMVMLSCETDFVSKNEDFIKLCRDIAMHAAATKPEYIAREDVGEAALKELETIFLPAVADKPENLREQILAGKVQSRLKEIVLLEQPFIKDDSKTVAQLLLDAAQKFGERVEVSKLGCFSVK
ncbi:MAG: elongation factor Ts [Candidatus Adlerbacteria bacterium]|nr:elongation factor Ts [Candidatus Adlerbacteria bacterium]